MPKEDLNRRIRRYSLEKGINQGVVPTLAYKNYSSNITNEDLIDLLNNCNAKARLKAYAALIDKDLKFLEPNILEEYSKKITNEDLIELLNNCDAETQLKAYAALIDKKLIPLREEVIDNFLTENGF